MASGWNVWVWLECIGGIIIDIHIIIITFPYSMHLYLLFCSSIPISLFILKTFFRSCLCYFCAML